MGFYLQGSGAPNWVTLASMLPGIALLACAVVLGLINNQLTPITTDCPCCQREITMARNEFGHALRCGQCGATFKPELPRWEPRRLTLLEVAFVIGSVVLLAPIVALARLLHPAWLAGMFPAGLILVAANKWVHRSPSASRRPKTAAQWVVALGILAILAAILFFVRLWETRSESYEWLLAM
jgi:hypothetical protein